MKHILMQMQQFLWMSIHTYIIGDYGVSVQLCCCGFDIFDTKANASKKHGFSAIIGIFRPKNALLFGDMNEDKYN